MQNPAISWSLLASKILTRISTSLDMHANDGTCLHLYTDYETGNKYVIKTGQDPARQKQIQTELRILQELIHDSIIKVESVYDRDGCTPGIVMRYAVGGDLGRYIRKEGPLAEDLVKRTVKKILEALEYIHGMGIVHCDIKPANIFITGTDYTGDNVVLADFGLAVELNEYGYFNERQGTLDCAAEELFFIEKRRSEKVDIWALGVTFFECLMGDLPYVLDGNLCPQWKKDLARSMRDHFPLAYDLCARMMTGAEGRISAHDALTHPWFGDL